MPDNSPVACFETPYFAHSGALGRDEANASQEVEVAVVLLGQVIQGLCASSLVERFLGKQEALGAFAVRIVNGAHSQWLPDSKDDGEEEEEGVAP